jgi:hypothetical protein
MMLVVDVVGCLVGLIIIIFYSAFAEITSTCILDETELKYRTISAIFSQVNARFRMKNGVENWRNNPEVN